MTPDKPPSFETIERSEKSDKSGYYEFRNVPDFYHPIYPGQAEFAFKAGQVLTAFRKQWMAEHVDDTWAKGVEMDFVPVLSDGMIMGYLGISEIDGESYDYLPAKQIREEESK